MALQVALWEQRVVQLSQWARPRGWHLDCPHQASIVTPCPNAQVAYAHAHTWRRCIPSGAECGAQGSAAGARRRLVRACSRGGAGKCQAESKSMPWAWVEGGAGKCSCPPDAAYCGLPFERVWLPVRMQQTLVGLPCSVSAASGSTMPNLWLELTPCNVPLFQCPVHCPTLPQAAGFTISPLMSKYVPPDACLHPVTNLLACLAAACRLRASPFHRSCPSMCAWQAGRRAKKAW